MTKRIAVTGMSINTPIGDNLDVFLNNLLNGKSAITKWKTIPDKTIYSKIGGDLSNYDIKSKLDSFKGLVSDEIFIRLKNLIKRAPWSIKLSMLVAVDAYLDAKLFESDYDNNEISTIVAGHNINQQYVYSNHRQFVEEPDFIDGLFALHGLDTDHAGSVSEVLQFKGPTHTIGGACASGNLALSSAIDNIKYHGMTAAMIVSPVLDFSTMDLHAMALMGAISYESFNERPEKACRPYDIDREGFVPSHGAAALVIEDLDIARARGARIYAEILAVGSNADGSHLPQPSVEGQSYLISKLLQDSGIHPDQIDFIAAHATSTPLGDLAEIRSIKKAFGKHTKNLKINAPKSMLGHTCWSAATVETVAAILQMNKGELHPSINIDNIDPEVDLDIGRTKIKYKSNILMKNSFGFGGINSISIIKRYE